MSWQSGLGERDISMLLQNAARETNAVTAASEQVAELRGPVTNVSLLVTLWLFRLIEHRDQST